MGMKVEIKQKRIAPQGLCVQGLCKGLPALLTYSMNTFNRHKGWQPCSFIRIPVLRYCFLFYFSFILLYQIISTLHLFYSGPWLINDEHLHQRLVF